MIILDNATLSYKGTTSELIAESLTIIEEIFNNLDIMEQYVYTQRIMSTLVHAKEDECEDEEGE